MSNVTKFPRKTSPRGPRNEGRGVYFVEAGEQGGGSWILAQVEDHGDKAVVRLTPLRADPPNAPKRKYIVDTVLEGFRLAYRVHGIHNARISQTSPNRYSVQIPPTISGSETASA